MGALVFIALLAGTLALSTMAAWNTFQGDDCAHKGPEKVPKK